MKMPLKILMVLHMPWNRNLGGSRVQLELAEEFQALGHYVEKFDYLDAFPNPKNSLIRKLFLPSFSKKAKEFVKANANRFDIIDAHQYNLPYSKQELGFKGLLVARSVGLMPLAKEFKKIEKKKWPSSSLKQRLTSSMFSWMQERDFKNFLPSLQVCDLINLPNQDELIYVRDTLGLGEKCVFFPFGLSQKRQNDFREAIQPVSKKLANKQVAFIGYWSPRKGTKDWKEIMLRIRSQVPKANFLFLGTGLSPKAVLSDLELPLCDWIKVVPNYESHELPNLLSGATIGAFPSYMEGFGFAVLEKLASGLPTVAYDIPGPREMLSHFPTNFLTPSGNIEKFSDQLANLLCLEESAYTQLVQHCLDVAKQFEWSKIAQKHLEVYERYLNALSQFHDPS